MAQQPSVDFSWPTVNNLIAGKQTVAVPEPSSTAGLLVMSVGVVLWGVLRWVGA
jgi:hypothetical protein